MNQEEQTGVEQSLTGQADSQSVQPMQTAPETPALAEASQRPEIFHGHQRSLFGIQAFFTVVIFSIFVITFIVQAFQIPSGSMENTLLIGDFLLVDKLHFAGNAGAGRLLPYGKIERGDIIVFYFPVDSSQFLVKRVIGLPGDHIRLRNKIVYVNGVPLHESYAIHRQWIPDGYRDNFPSQQGAAREIDRRWRYQLQNYMSDGEVVVPPDQYFVLGDNRDQSLDSRYWGFVPRANIIGRPLVIYLSVRGPESGGSNDKLLHSGQMAHWLHMARWDRMFRLVR
ncbi:MAG TPA: signal peptidase I [Candidatus Angelobacter sp.]|nr:signal peptidase I [Candidatus Angelobacter sp.]